MEEENKKGLSTTTVVLMISTALFFDVLQWFMAFLFMDWAVGIFAGMTFYVWFMIHGISFMKPKRLFAFWGAEFIESVPFLSTFLSWIPAWTAAVAYLALEAKAQSIIPGADITKLGIGRIRLERKNAGINKPPQRKGEEPSSNQGMEKGERNKQRPYSLNKTQKNEKGEFEGETSSVLRAASNSQQRGPDWMYDKKAGENIRLRNERFEVARRLGMDSAEAANTVIDMEKRRNRI